MAEAPGYWKAEHALAMRQVASLEARVKRLQTAIEQFLSGDYDHPRSFRPYTCPHNASHWEECGLCDEAHFRAALKDIPDAKETA